MCFLAQMAERAAGREVPGPAGASGCADSHPFGWRDAMDIIVKWRQLSEPNDQVPLPFHAEQLSLLSNSAFEEPGLFNQFCLLIRYCHSLQSESLSRKPKVPRNQETRGFRSIWPM